MGTNLGAYALKHQCASNNNIQQEI